MEEVHTPSQRPLDPATWVARYGDYLYRNALLRLGDGHLAEDVVQETLLAALQACERFSAHSSERTWLTGILKHKVIDCLRRSGREKNSAVDEPLPEEEEHPFQSGGEWPGHWRPERSLQPQDWGPNPMAELEKKEFWEALHCCLSGMPPRLAQAFVLREIDGLESAEVCKVLAVSPTNLWVMLHRARAQLRRCMERRWMASEAGEKGP